MIDADGLLVTPGFVDIHTHYDAQLHWDPTASPASWHGVTTLLTGNCGFTLAPAKPDDVEWLLLMLSRVEGMSADALAAGVDFARRVARPTSSTASTGRVGVNVGANVGHCAVRRYVMGDDASERTATDDEIAQMQALVRAALARRRDRVHVVTARPARRPRRPRRARRTTRRPTSWSRSRRCSASSAAGAIEFIPRTFLTGYYDDDRELDPARWRARPAGRCTSTRSR